jgi:hypothetical protein
MAATNKCLAHTGSNPHGFAVVPANRGFLRHLLPHLRAMEASVITPRCGKPASGHACALAEAGKMPEPPTMAATNKCLARNIKTRTAKANKRQEKLYRQRQFRELGQS